jgi:hypothetical protein
MTDGKDPDDELHDAEVIEHREQRGDEHDRRQDHERKDVRVLPPSAPRTLVMIFGQTSGFPSGRRQTTNRRR